jgi:hypothetical protein
MSCGRFNQAYRNSESVLTLYFVVVFDRLRRNGIVAGRDTVVVLGMRTPGI